MEAFHTSDPTRPVTQALFRPNVSHDYDNGLADLLDVVGQNYRENEILAAHEQKPTRKILGTENTHDRRGWLALRDNAAYAGQFLWAGIDYLGESRAWPTISGFSACWIAPAKSSRWAMSGRVGGAARRWCTSRGAWRRAKWRRPTPATRHIAARCRRCSTTGRRRIAAAHEENVEVYSNCEEVELLLNGKSLGTKALAEDASARNWRVNWEAGTLQAVCQNGAARDELRTAGKAAAVVLTVDRPRVAAAWDDVAYVTAEVVDERGVVVPSAGNEIRFVVSGPGAVVAVDNQDIASHESFQGSVRRAFQGRCIAIVRANGVGRIGITGSAGSLKSGTVGLEGR